MAICNAGCRMQVAGCRMQVADCNVSVEAQVERNRDGEGLCLDGTVPVRR
jgi:hypothetical protein